MNNIVKMMFHILDKITISSISKSQLLMTAEHY